MHEFVDRTHDVPEIVQKVLDSPGHQLDSETRASMSPRFGSDFSQVRVHTDAPAAASARAVGARAYTVGNHIVFGAGRYAPGTAAGDRLLTHELTHVVQQHHATPPRDGLRLGRPDEPAEHEADAVAAGRSVQPGRTAGPAVLRRQPDETPIVDVRMRLNNALAHRQWTDAVRALTEMNAADRHAELQALDGEARERLHAAALELNPSSANQLVAELDALEVAAPARRDAPGPVDVAAMSAPDKLLKAWEYAKPRLGPDVVAQLEGMFSRRSLAMMGAFAVLYVAAQLTPAGWVADGIALATLTVSAFFVGMTVFHVFANLGRFLAAVDATSVEDLQAAGEALSAAIAEGGVGLVTALLTRTLGRGMGRPGGRGGGRTYEGPPPTGYVEALTEVGLVRMPAAAVQSVAKTPSAVQQLASFAVMTPPPAGTSPQSAGTPPPAAGRPPQRPEIWEQISRELDLDPTTAEAAPTDVAGAARDARAAGLTGVPGGQPGRVHLEVQPHRTAPQARSGLGVSGSDVQSAHVGPTSFLRDVPGYSRGGADTVLLERATHAAFDQHWKDWAMAQRRAGRTAVSTSELYAVMLDAIDQIPKLSQLTKNAMAWRLQLELFRDLGLSPTDTVTLPYPNVSPTP